MHIYDPESSLTVFSFRDKLIEQEVALWNGVEFVDFNLHLFFSTSPVNNQSLVLHEAQKYLNARRSKSHQFVSLGKIWNLKNTASPSKDQFNCLIDIKKEFIFAETENIPIPPTGKKKVALLVPTLNTEAAGNLPLKSYLLDSLKISLLPADSDNFLISIYIAYDDGDAVFDDPQSSIVEELQRDYPSFRFRAIKMFKTHWLTFIWNRLFVIAYREGNDFFLQINDDVQLLNRGWLSPTVDLLQNASVVGLNDYVWNCKIFTQALVGRSHYDNFGGFFFPPGIKDWYSDNWITNVYGPKQSKCSLSARIKNSNIKTRYNGCRKFRLI